MVEVVIRIARSEERQALEALQLRASLANDGDHQGLLDHPDAVSLPPWQIEAGLVIVAEADEAVVGFAALLLRDDSNVELDGLFVEPGLWRRGIGHALVEECVELARRMKAAHLHVLGNPQALGFYERCDFGTVRVEPTRFGPAIRMRRVL